MKILQRLYLTLLTLSVTMNSLAAGIFSSQAPLPEISFPEGTRTSWIAENIQVNHVPTSLIAFDYAGDADQFEQFYKDAWQGPFFNKAKLGQEFLIGHREGDLYTSLRYQVAFGKVSGHATRSRITARANQPLTTKLPLPMGSNIEQIIQSLDNGREAESITAKNRLSRNGNARYMITELRHRGWYLETPVDAYRNNLHGDTIQLEWSKQSSLLQITFYPSQNPTDNSTGMLIHWIK